MRACFRCPECTAAGPRPDDLLLVANMRVSQRARLIDAGITTMTRAGTPRRPGARTAGPDHRGTDRAGPAAGRPPRSTAGRRTRWSTRSRSALLPDPDKGDLFFDFEGDPLWTADGTEWGLEYLFGVLERRRHVPAAVGARPPQRAPGARRLPRRWCASAASATRSMHIYHYAAYEKTALLRLAGRYGVGEDEVDDLLRNGVLVDLYPLVRKSIRVGTENYSLKSLEPLYMGYELRAGEVTTATDSIVQYARYCELRDDGRDDEAAVVLKEIEDYNHYDCTVDAQAARLADQPRHRIRRAAARCPARHRRRRTDRPTTTNRPHARGLRRRRRRRPHRRTDRGRAGRRGPRIPPARGQAVLVGALRPAQQSRRRMGRQQRRLHGRHAPRSCSRLAPAAARAQANASAG